MALTGNQYAAMKLTFRALLSANTFAAIPNVSEAGLLSFFAALLTASSGASAIDVEREKVVNRTLRAQLGGSYAMPIVSRADLADFFTQLATDSSGAAALPAGQYGPLELRLRALCSGTPGVPSNLSSGELYSYFITYGGFDGNFAALFDSLTSASATVGYYRGDLGLSTTGGIVNAWANQIVGGSAWGNIIEVGAGVGVGTATAGVGGKAAISGNGSTQGGGFATVPGTIIAPATAPLQYYAVMRSTALPATTAFFIGKGFNFAVYQTASTLNLNQFNGSANNAQALATNAWGALATAWTGSTSDYHKWGANAPTTGVNSGNAVSGSGAMGLFCDPAGNFGPFECALLLIGRATTAQFVAALPALGAAVTSYYGGTVGV